MTCGTCAHLDVRPDRDGVTRRRKGLAYSCRAQIPPRQLPACIVPNFTRCFVEIVDGKDCSFHTRLTTVRCDECDNGLEDGWTHCPFCGEWIHR